MVLNGLQSSSGEVDSTQRNQCTPCKCIQAGQKIKWFTMAVLISLMQEGCCLIKQRKSRWVKMLVDLAKLAMMGFCGYLIFMVISAMIVVSGFGLFYLIITC